MCSLQVFDKVVECLEDNGRRNNLLNSSVIELFEFMRQVPFQVSRPLWNDNLVHERETEGQWPLPISMRETIVLQGSIHEMRGYPNDHPMNRPPSSSRVAEWSCDPNECSPVTVDSLAFQHSDVTELSTVQNGSRCIVHGYDWTVDLGVIIDWLIISC